MQAALDYLVSEKLLDFAETAMSHPDFAHELPMFVAEVRRLFAPDELCAHMAALVLKLKATAEGCAEADEDAFAHITPKELASRLDRLKICQQLLEVDYLGTS